MSADQHVIFAHTGLGTDLWIKREPNGVTLTARDGAEWTTIALPLADFRKMIEACRDEELIQLVGALIHGKAPDAPQTPQPKDITINGKLHRLTDEMLSYRDVVGMAGQPDGASVIYWVHRGPRGSLVRGQIVRVLDGMHFDAAVTGAA